MRLTDRIWLIGSGEPGWALSDEADSQVYAVDTGDGYAVIDTGTGSSIETIVAESDRDGIEPRAIRWLLITHGHADHAGGAAAWRRVLPHVRVFASDEVAGWLANGDEEATSTDRAVVAGVYPPHYRLQPCDVEGLGDAATVELGGLSLTIVQTPGHAAGHLAFIADVDGARTLFSGDALFPEGRILLQDLWDCDLDASLRSVERLAGVGAERLFAGHRPPVFEGAADHLRKATDRIARLLVPESLV